MSGAEEIVDMEDQDDFDALLDEFSGDIIEEEEEDEYESEEEEGEECEECEQEEVSSDIVPVQKKVVLSTDYADNMVKLGKTSRGKDIMLIVPKTADLVEKIHFLGTDASDSVYVNNFFHTMAQKGNLFQLQYITYINLVFSFCS